MSTNMKWRSFAFVNPIDGLQIIYCFKGMNDVDTVDGHIFCTIFFFTQVLQHIISSIVMSSLRSHDVIP